MTTEVCHFKSKPPIFKSPVDSGTYHKVGTSKYGIILACPENGIRNDYNNNGRESGLIPQWRVKAYQYCKGISIAAFIELLSQRITIHSEGQENDNC